MIELPSSPGANGVAPSFADAGFTLRGGIGGPNVRVDRPGSRYRAQISYPPMEKADADVFVSRLIRAKSEGLRIPYPLLGVSQGVPGAPVVDGAGQSGKTLNLRGLRAGYVFREGSWLSIEDATGQHYLHNVAAFAKVGGAGTIALPLSEALREPFADGATAHVAKPMIQGTVQGESVDWVIRLDHLYEVSFAIEEDA